ncbi:phage replisome organizer N-terminal domain-containing protein [Bacillus toyonensis]
MSNIKWIKLSTSMFEDEKIKLIESLPEADTILIIWIKLLSLAGKTNATGGVYLNENIPYTDEMLSTIFDRPLQTVRLALTTFVQYGMIEITDHNFIFISNWEKHQNIDGMEKIRLQTAKRVRKHREKKEQEQLALEGENNKKDVTLHVTRGNATEEDKELEEDIDKDIKNIKPSCNKYEICHMDAAKYFHHLILSRNKNFKQPPLDSWAKDIRLMQERDNRNLEDIKKVMDWCQKDTFWMNNVLSISKLRKQFDQLYMKMRWYSKTGTQYRDKLFYIRGVSKRRNVYGNLNNER